MNFFKKKKDSKSQKPFAKLIIYFICVIFFVAISQVFFFSNHHSKNSSTRKSKTNEVNLVQNFPNSHNEEFVSSSFDESLRENYKLELDDFVKKEYDGKILKYSSIKGKFYRCDVQMLMFKFENKKVLRFTSKIQTRKVFYMDSRYLCSFESAFLTNSDLKFCFFISGFDVETNKKFLSVFEKYNNFEVIEFNLMHVINSNEVTRVAFNSPWWKHSHFWGINIYDMISFSLVAKNNGGFFSGNDVIFMKNISKLFEKKKDVIGMFANGKYGKEFCWNAVYLITNNSVFHEKLGDECISKRNIKGRKSGLFNCGPKGFGNVCSRKLNVREKRNINFLSSLEAFGYPSEFPKEKMSFDIDHIMRFALLRGEELEKWLKKLYDGGYFFHVLRDLYGQEQNWSRNYLKNNTLIAEIGAKYCPSISFVREFDENSQINEMKNIKIQDVFKEKNSPQFNKNF